MEKIILLYLFIINTITFFIYRTDKKRAIKHQYRIPENVLFFITLLGGTIGAISAMLVFNHKKAKFSFVAKLFIIITIQILIIWNFIEYR